MENYTTEYLLGRIRGLTFGCAIIAQRSGDNDLIKKDLKKCLGALSSDLDDIRAALKVTGGDGYEGFLDSLTELSNFLNSKVVRISHGPNLEGTF